MAHSQYPFLLKHQFLEWMDNWRNDRTSLPLETRWKAFIVCMVYAIAFLMTKARVNGRDRAEALYSLATSKYLSYLVSAPDPVIRAQGLLLLTIYALHMPFQENIISLSSWTMRFCIMAQLHLAETEPQPTDTDALLQIQHRRKIFWCAYAIDRAVCSSFDFPTSIPDNHITVDIFENVDDDLLLEVASSTQPGTPLRGYSGYTNLSTALHVLVGRQLESEIQNTVLDKTYLPHSDVTFTWRIKLMEKLKEWNKGLEQSCKPTQRGYVSPGWLTMIYYYNIVMLFRPTRRTAHGISGDWSVQACCHSLVLFRRFQMAREIAQPWLGLLTQFQIGVTLLYCFFATPPSRWKDSYTSPDVSDAIRACSSTLAILAERWAEAECVRDTFELLAGEIPIGLTWERPAMISAAAMNGIEEHWAGLSKVVIHQPTLRMIREMATEPLVADFEIPSEFEHDNSVTVDVMNSLEGVTPPMTEEMHRQWMGDLQGGLGEASTQHQISTFQIGYISACS
uniref:Xylanolytic transcriptional activator regulatory domain-containing protein n=1 Tax=Bionectria ochroleuca TaxID=29856 RepID=A0A8H7KCW2_BIOOC